MSSNWRNKVKDEKMFNQIKLAMREFLSTWKSLITDLLWPNINKGGDANTVAQNLQLMAHCTSIGHSFAYECPDEVEEAFKDTMEPFFHLLNFQQKHAQLCKNNTVVKYLALCWNDIMHILRLLATHFEETNEIFAPAFLP